MVETSYTPKPASRNGPIYGYMHTASNEGPVIAYYNHVSVESNVRRSGQRSPSPWAAFSVISTGVLNRAGYSRRFPENQSKSRHIPTSFPTEKLWIDVQSCAGKAIHKLVTSLPPEDFRPSQTSEPRELGEF